MLRVAFYGLLGACLLGLVAAGGLYWYLVPGLPSIETLKDVRLQVPLRVYAADGQVIAEFGEKRRVPVTLAETPERLLQAFMAAEDDRFYRHPGVDWRAILRAAIHLVRTGEKTQGGSTITMQVARNFFLSREKTYLRKLNEILLALKIERELDKDAIFELYLNKIYLGHRAYGVGAAAQVYYGARLGELTLAQLAMIAGLPKAPSRVNPISNPDLAIGRRNYVLGRMLELGFITPAEHEAARGAGVTASYHGLSVELEAPYVAEMVRSELVRRYGEEAYTAGLKAYTTVDSRLQRAANDALRKALIDYDRRHGYRGPEHRYELEPDAGEARWSELLEGFTTVAGLVPALVVAVDEEAAEVYAPGPGLARIAMEHMSWARPYVSHDRRGARPQAPADVLAPGDVVRIRRLPAGGDESSAGAAPAGEAGEPANGAGGTPTPPPATWALAQIPRVEGALVSLAPRDGAILALVGGFDFSQSKFNRVTQARRQPGSNFKPFIYSAALHAGETAATFINDAPIVFDAPGLESIWRPENYSGKYFGPTRLREALTKSRNLVSIRLLRRIGVAYAVDYLTRFGFERERLPANLSLALGSGEVAPLELVRGYATFANGGYRITPYLLERVVTDAGEVLLESEPLYACRECEAVQAAADEEEPATIEELQARLEREAETRLAPRAIPAENAWIMTSMMGDVIRYGTGRRARALGRRDLAGKTGTTNEQKDAWFSGFNSRIVTTTWVGFDQSLPLGRQETGARAALPMWMEYMRVALEGMPESRPDQPPGLVTVRIDPDTGRLTSADDPDAIFEVFRDDQVPENGYVGPVTPHGEGGIPEQLF